MHSRIGQRRPQQRCGTAESHVYPSFYLSLIGLIILTVYFAWPLLQFHILGGHDTGFYPPRYVEFYQLLAAGVFPPRWAPDFSSGYGEPFFSYNPPLVYILNALFHRFGASFIASENLAALMLIFIAGLGMYCLAREFFGARGGLVSAAAYLSAPYFLVDLYVRHSMPDFAAFAFLPFSFWGLYCYAEDGHAVPLLSGGLGTALLLLSSNPIALVALPALGLGLLAQAWARRRLAVVRRGGWCLALGLALSAFFSLPAFAEQGLIHTERLLQADLRYSNHFVEPWQLVTSPWGYGIAAPDGLSFSIGIMHLLLAGIGVAVGATLLVRRFSARHGRELGFPMLVGLALVGVGAFMTTAGSHAVWDHATTLQYLQFPWRLLSLVAFGAALLAGLSVAFKPAATGRWWWAANGLVAVLVAAALADTRGHAHPAPNWRPLYPIDQLTTEAIADRGIDVDLRGEFEPRRLTIKPTRSAPAPVSLLQGQAEIAIDQQSPTRLDLTVLATSAASVRINIHYFEGWTVLDSGKTMAFDSTTPDDLMELSLAPGQHHLSVIFRDTPIRRAANTLSLLAVPAAAVSLLWRRLHIADIVHNRAARWRHTNG